MNTTPTPNGARLRAVCAVVLGVIAVAAIVAATIIKLDDAGTDLAPLSTIGGAAVGALATLAAFR